MPSKKIRAQAQLIDAIEEEINAHCRKGFHEPDSVIRYIAVIIAGYKMREKKAKDGV